MLRQVSIGVRIFFIILCMLLFIGGVIGAFLYNSNVVRDISVHEVNDLMLDGQKQKISLATISLAKSLGTVLAGVDDEAERVKIIRAAIDGIRYEADNSGYIFVYEGTTVLALPPKKSLQGNDLGGMKDKNGLFVIKALAKTAKDGGGFVEYVWDKPGAGDQPKLSYATMIPGTNYWIGTGVYIDNIEAKKKVIASTIDGLMQSSVALILGVLGLVLLFLVLPLAYLIGRSISAPVQQATEAAERISNGEFDIQLDDSGRDQVAQLMTALNAMASTLRDNIKEITTKTNEAEEKARAAEEATLLANEATEKAKTAKAEGMFHAAQRLEEVVERITTASEEISAQSEEIRQGTDVQRERLSGTATAMEEMNATVLEVAQNASLAAEQGQEAREKALHGADVVGQSIEAMDTTQRQTVALKENMTQLDEQAKAIGNIMGVITDIADQTNLLALNAAIEAARAGDAGRGFAVVADEVRKLAEKTMGATKEVGDSIDAIQTAADENVKSVELAVEDLGKATELSSQSGEVLKEIVAGAEISADQIQGIATAAEQQSASSEEINMSVDEINRIAMETAQGVQESTEALQELANQALSLNDLVQELKEEGQE